MIGRRRAVIGRVMHFKDQIMVLGNFYGLLGRVSFGVVRVAGHEIVDHVGPLAVEAIQQRHRCQAVVSLVTLRRG